MGVKNLWRLLLPVGRRLSIETLSHQTLAIDASIWLTQISKACRDPETGRAASPDNKPHVRIFLLRLMKLLYHQIKPVVVFDGVMPAVKRREIQRRRARSERLWRDNDDDDENTNYSDDHDNNDSGESKEKSASSTSFGGGGGGGALKRAAKKILVRQLKEWREREAKIMHRKKRKKNNGDDDSDECGHDHESNSRERKHHPGAFAAGFTVNESVGESVESTVSTLQTRKKNGDLFPDPMGKTRIDDNKIEIITINSDDGERDHGAIHPSASKLNDKATHNLHELLNDDDDDDDDKSDNDWEMARAVQLSVNDSIHHHPQQENRRQPELSLMANNPNTNPFDHSQHQPLIDIETIASLPSEARYHWIDSQWKTQRIQSRRECIQAAANPEEYSMTQLRNFYKSNALAKRVSEISKLLETKTGDGVERSSAQRVRPALLRSRRHNQEASSTDDDDEDNEMFVSSRNNNAEVSMKVLFGEDDSNEENDFVDDGGGGDGEGGFLLSSPAAETLAIDKMQKDVDLELLDDDSDSDDRSKIGTGSSESQRVTITSLHGSTNENHINDLDAHPTCDRQNIKTNQLTKLHDIFTAEQEWAEWGGQVEDEIRVDSTEKAEVLDFTESESDEEGMEGTFLVVDHATDHLNRPDTKQNVVSCALTATDVLDIKVDGAEEEDVEWEDGDLGVEVEQGYNPGASKCDLQSISLHEAKTASCDDNHAGFSNHSLKEHVHSSPDYVARLDPIKCKAIEIPSDEDENEEMQLEEADLNELKSNSTSDVIAVLTTNNFDVSTGKSTSMDGQQAAALQRAQETASSLTSWAGRAFQRAISTLTTHQTQTDSSCQTNQLEDIEVVRTVAPTDEDKVIAEDGCAAPPTSDPFQEPNHSFPAGNLNNHRMPVFFDTSLQGLTDAHNAILKEERTMERDMSTITDEMKADILELLQLCGIPWIESPSEAEAQCAALEELGLVDGVVTEDSDIFVFGGKKVYKNFFKEQKFVEAYFAKDIERDLALKKHQLVALAMLLGGDYTDGVKGVGIVNGMEILQAFPIDDSEEGIKSGLKRFREWLDGFGDTLLNHDEDSSLSHKEYLFRNKHKSARTRWVAPLDFPSPGILNAYLKPAVDKTQAKFTWATPDLQGLQCYCAETIGWDMAETDRVVHPVLKVLESGSKQTRIESYFMRYEDGIKFARVRSKRLKAVLTDIHGGDDASIDVEIKDVREVQNHDITNGEKSAPKKKRRLK